MRSLIIAATAALAFASSASHAETTGKFYAGLGYNILGDEDLSFGSINARIGYDFTKNFAIEAEAGFGVTEEDFTEDFGFNATAKVDTMFGAFVVAKAPISDNFDLFGRLGYTTAQIGVDTAFGNGDGDISSFAVGIGAQYLFDAKNGIRGDYTRLTEDDGTNSFTISYIRKF